MQMVRPSARTDGGRVGDGLTALLASTDGRAGLTQRRLAALGVGVAAQGGLYDMLAEVLDDPRTADLLVLECDTIGGLDVGRRAFCILVDAKVRMPVFLIASDCDRQSFPVAREAPFILSAPVSGSALRLAVSAAFPVIADTTPPHPVKVDLVAQGTTRGGKKKGASHRDTPWPFMRAGGL